MPSKPMLGYFELRGWAGSIRLLLTYLEVDYVELLYQSPSGIHSSEGVNNELPEWTDQKDSLGLDFPNLPYWIDEDCKLTETKAILKHICRKYAPELLGKTNKQQSKANMLEEVLWDFWNSLTQTCLENTAELRFKFYKDIQKKLDNLSRFIRDTNWSTGNSITYVDFLLYEICCQHKAFDGNIFEPHKNLAKFVLQVENLPPIRKLLCRPTYKSYPFYSFKFRCKL